MTWLSRFLRRPKPAPRDEQGRFVSAHRQKVIATTRQMCADIGRDVPEPIR